MIFTNSIDPIMFSAGPVSVRWYGFLFAVGIALNYMILRWAFRREGYKVEDLDSVAVYLFFGLLLGARLGHTFFYEADYYLANPIEILKVWKGGLASHGAAIGLFLSYWLWCAVHKVKFAKHVDVISLGMMVTGAFVRLGNFFNSEIVGKATDGSWGVVFSRVDQVARHPVQLYEAGMQLVVFGLLLWVYKKFYKKRPPLFIMFLLLFWYFLGRFVIEIWKEDLGGVAIGSLSAGQVLSLVPMIVAVVWFAFVMPRMKVRGE